MQETTSYLLIPISVADLKVLISEAVQETLIMDKTADQEQTITLTEASKRFR